MNPSSFISLPNLNEQSKSVMQDIVEKEGSSVGRVRGKDSGVDDDGDKEDVVDRVGDSEGTNGPANTNINLSRKELERLLKHGAYDIFRSVDYTIPYAWLC